MNGKNEDKKLERIVRFTGGGVLLLAVTGLILFSPLSASGQDARHGRGIHEAGGAGGHYPGAMDAGQRRFAADPEEHIAYLEIVLDLSADQVEKIRPILTEHREKMDKLRGEDGMRGRRDARMNRMQERCCCDKVDRVERRGEIRRHRREMEKNREKTRKRLERSREEMDGRLSKVLDEGQMEKYRALRELRDDRREQRDDRREHREERMQRHGGRV